MLSIINWSFGSTWDISEHGVNQTIYNCKFTTESAQLITHGGIVAVSMTLVMELLMKLKIYAVFKGLIV